MTFQTRPSSTLSHGASNAFVEKRRQRAQDLTYVTLSSSGPSRGIHLYHGPDEPVFRGPCQSCGKQAMIIGIIDDVIACGPCIDTFTTRRMDPYLFNGKPRSFVSTRVTPHTSGEKAVFDNERID